MFFSVGHPVVRVRAALVAHRVGVFLLPLGARGMRLPLDAVLPLPTFMLGALMEAHPFGLFRRLLHRQAQRQLAAVLWLAQFHVEDGGELRFLLRVLEQAGGGAVVVFDHGDNASVVIRHRAQVRGGQPPIRSTLHPPTLCQKEVQHLVIGGAFVGFEGHRLGPRIQDGLGAACLVEKCHRTADVGRVLGGGHRLIAPVVEQRHVTVIIGPAAGRKEVGEAVEL